MKKLVNIFAAVIIAANTFAQDDIYISNSNKDDVIASVGKSLFGEDCVSCSFPASEQRRAIVKILNNYNLCAKWGYGMIAESNLPEFIKHSEIISGDQVNGMIVVYKTSETGFGYSQTEKIFPRSTDKFLAFRGIPFIKVEGKPRKPETEIVVSDLTPPIVNPPTVRRQSNYQVAEKPASNHFVKTEDGNTVINIYNNGGQPNGYAYNNGGVWDNGWFNNSYYHTQPRSYGPNGAPCYSQPSSYGPNGTYIGGYNGYNGHNYYGNSYYGVRGSVSIYGGGYR